MRRVLSDPIADDAPIESVLDLVQFMIREKAFLEARSLLEQQRVGDEENLDVRLLLVDISRRFGDLREGNQLLAESRALADTSAKYRRWLEAGVALQDEFETTAGFLQAEFGQLQSESTRWDEKSLARLLAYVDVAGRSEIQSEIVAFLEQELTTELPDKTKAELRRKLIATIESDLKQIPALEKQLKLLAKSQPDMQSEVNARLVMLYNKQERHDLITPLLAKIDIDQLKDPALLSSLLGIVRSRNYNAKQILSILRRQTEINPTDRNNWQQWLTQLAAASDENQLRAAIRRLISGVEKMEIGEDSRRALQKRLVDSYWRSACGMIVRDETHAWSESLVLLDAVEPMVKSELQWSWVYWLRAYALRKLEREEAAEEAVAEWERVVKLICGVVAPEGKTDEPPVTDKNAAKLAMQSIVLPDGISISLQHARELLKNRLL